MPNAKQRQRYGYREWKKYLEDSTGKNLEYNNDYYKYLRGVNVIRDLEDYEKFYMKAYDEVIFGVKGSDQ